jgi:glycosyltransferase involved in cell wall biosynthesis
MSSRRILLINHEFPPLGGGSGNATRHIAAGLARLGHQPCVITGAWAGLPATEHVDGVMIRRVATPRSDLRSISTGEAARFMTSAMIAAAGLHKHWKADAVVAFCTWPAAPVGWFMKTSRRLPYIVVLKNGDIPQRDPEDETHTHKVADRAVKHLWRHAGAVIANSLALADEARAFAPAQRVAMIPAGAHVEGIVPKEDYAAQDHVRLLYVGRLEKHKGLDVLLPALAKVTSALKWKLRLVGDGPEWPAIAAHAARFALIDRVELCGWQGWNTLPEMYRNADIFVLPSHTDDMPAALLEAMATGLPVVATRVAGAGEAVLHDETGLLTPPSDSDALADALTAMMADPTRWETLGRKGRARVENYYSWKNVAEKWIDVIEQVIAAKP